MTINNNNKNGKKRDLWTLKQSITVVVVRTPVLRVEDSAQNCTLSVPAVNSTRFLLTVLVECMVRWLPASCGDLSYIQELYNIHAPGSIFRDTFEYLIE
jgi:hypothetical protein